LREVGRLYESPHAFTPPAESLPPQ
jgi:hypothetical protein